MHWSPTPYSCRGCRRFEKHACEVLRQANARRRQAAAAKTCCMCLRRRRVSAQVRGSRTKFVSSCSVWRRTAAKTARCLLLVCCVMHLRRHQAPATGGIRSLGLPRLGAPMSSLNVTPCALKARSCAAAGGRGFGGAGALVPPVRARQCRGPAQDRQEARQARRQRRRPEVCSGTLPHLAVPSVSCT